MMQGKFYTVDELAEHWKVSRDTILRLIDRKELGAIKIGRQWRISAEEMERFLKKEQETA